MLAFAATDPMAPELTGREVCNNPSTANCYFAPPISSAVGYRPEFRQFLR